MKRFGKYYLAAEKDGEVIGFVSGFDDTGIFYGYMGRLVVDARYRRIGIGRELTKACLEEFRKSGVAVVFAGVKNGNIASLELLAKEGFLDDGYKLLRKIYI